MTHPTDRVHVATLTLARFGYAATPCSLDTIEVLDPVQCSNGTRGTWTEYIAVRLHTDQVHAFLRERS